MREHGADGNHPPRALPLKNPGNTGSNSWRLIVDDRSNTPELPRVLNSARLEIIDGSLVIHTIDDESDKSVEIARIPIGEVGSPRAIDETCVQWATGELDRANCMTFGIRRITDTLYAIRGPRFTRERLLLTRRDDGYQLEDTSQLPSRRVDMGVQDPGLSGERIVDAAAFRAELEGYEVIGYRRVDADTWCLVESAVPDPVAVVVQGYPGISTKMWRSVAVLFLGAFGALMAVLGDVNDWWWSPYVSTFAVFALCALLSYRRGDRRVRLHFWDCPVCSDNGVLFSTSSTSARGTEKIRDDHMVTYHGDERRS